MDANGPRPTEYVDIDAQVARAYAEAASLQPHLAGQSVVVTAMKIGFPGERCVESWWVDGADRAHGHSAPAAAAAETTETPLPEVPQGGAL